MSTDDKAQDKSAPKNRVRTRMQWWRAYEGLPTSPRWRVVARRAKRSLTEVLGVVLYLLDAASVAEERGDVSGFDAEVCGAALDIETDDAESIFKALEANGWIVDGRIATWDDRQTARSEDRTGAERQQRFRDKKKAATQSVTPVTSYIRDVTQSHDREEESRSDQSRAENLDVMVNEKTRRAIGRFFDDQVWPAYPQSRKHMERMPARVKFVDLVLGGADPHEILRGVQDYAASEPDPAYVRGCLKFLENEDWNAGEPLAEREWDASESETLWIPLGPPPAVDVQSEEYLEGRLPDSAYELNPTAKASLETIMAAVFTSDGQRRGKPVFPRDFGRPPIGGFLAAA